jgi:DsbC/DsbD-like thiol-disulfide interchange protein
MARAFILCTAVYPALAIFVSAGAPRSFAETPRPVQWTFTASARDSSSMHEGATAVAHLHAQIQHGWHVYALDQGPGGPVPMRISVPERQPFAIDGDIVAPTPKRAFDPNLNIKTRFYDDEATFTIPIKTTSAPSNGLRNISLDVLYQACNDRMCLSPTTLHLASAVSLSKGL